MGTTHNEVPNESIMTSKGKRRIRSACDQCHFRKLRCSGGEPCTSCQLSNQGSDCAYSLSSPLGRPKGVKNKLPRLNATATKSQENENHSSTLPRQIPESQQMIENCNLLASFMPYSMDAQVSMASSDSGGYDVSDEDFLTSANESNYAAGSSITPPSFSDTLAWSRGPELDLDITSISCFGLSESCTCTCLQQYASLLSHLRHMQSTGTPLPLDMLLSVTQRTFATWKQFTECTTAYHGNTHEEVMLLSALSLRNTLRLLHGYANFESVPTEHVHVGTHALDQGNQSPAYSQHQTYIPQTARGLIDMNVGRYRIGDDEGEMVSDMLALHILARIEYAAAALFKRASALMQVEMTPSIDQVLGLHRGEVGVLHQESGMGQVQHVLRGLGAVVDNTRRSLQWRHRMSVQRSSGS